LAASSKDENRMRRLHVRLTRVQIFRALYPMSVWRKGKWRKIPNPRGASWAPWFRKMAQRPWVDPDDAPELTDEWFDKAAIKIGEKVIRPARK
jgi:hypothetical protein